MSSRARKSREWSSSAAPAGTRHERTRADSRRSPATNPTSRTDDDSTFNSYALLNLYRPDLARVLMTQDVPSYRYTQLLEHLFRRPLRSMAEATALPGELRAALDPLAPSTQTEIEAVTSAEGTTKLLLQGRDGSRIETVLMRYAGRATVCISSQAGCPVGCVFCATGAIGFGRNLTAAEIVDQVRTAAALAAGENRRVSNVVYMGMGEPLLNLRPVLDSIRILTHPLGQGLGHRAISISTVGIPRGILRLAQAEPQVNLALSLHAADDATRALLIPENYRHPLAEIMEAAWQHFDLTHRKLLIEYVLLGGINDSADQARKLVALLRGHVLAVNLMEWNPVSPDHAPPPREPSGSLVNAVHSPSGIPRMRPASPAAVAAFRKTLEAAHIETVVRRSRGAPIQAACGQLAGRRSVGEVSGLEGKRPVMRSRAETLWGRREQGR